MSILEDAMTEFNKKAINFLVLITVAIVLLFVDLALWINGRPTWSETIWGVNQVTIALAFGVGVVVGHCFTVPKNIDR